MNFLALLLALPLAAADIDGSMEFDGRSRSWRLHVPEGLERAAAPLVIVFHGGFGTGRGVQKMTSFDAVADRERFLTLYPDGVRRAWNVGGGCCGKPGKERVDDTGFIDALLTKLSKERPIDMRRVFAAGISNGAMFSYALACRYPGRIAAVAAIAGMRRFPSCAAGPPVSVLHIHGTADPRAPWLGGRGTGFATIQHHSVPDGMAEWRKAAGCSGGGTDIYRNGAASCSSARPCADGADVVLCTVSGGGHSWPGGPPTLVTLLGEPNKDLDATAFAWEFFKAHPRKE